MHVQLSRPSRYDSHTSNLLLTPQLQTQWLVFSALLNIARQKSPTTDPAPARPESELPPSGSGVRTEPEPLTTDTDTMGGGVAIDSIRPLRDHARSKGSVRANATPFNDTGSREKVTSDALFHFKGNYGVFRDEKGGAPLWLFDSGS